MSRVISISNHKGGVGKTTTAVNLAAGLNAMGKKVLLVDLDAQANLTFSLGFNLNEERPNIYEAITGAAELQPIQIKPGLDVVASSLDLSGVDVELSGEAGREYLLKELLDPIKRRYDFIIIDTAPSLSLLTINAFTASDEVIIPLQAEVLAFQGLGKLAEVIDKIKKRLNKRLEIAGILITLYDSRRIINRDVVEAIQKNFKTKVFNTKIRGNVSLAEAPARGKDIFSYEPKSNGAEDYAALCKEILKPVKHINPRKPMLQI